MIAPTPKLVNSQPATCAFWSYRVYATSGTATAIAPAAPSSTITVSVSGPSSRSRAR